MADMTKSETMLWEYVLNCGTILSWLNSYELELERDQYTDYQREDFALFRQAVMSVLYQYNGYTLSESDWIRNHEQEAGK